MQQTVPIIVIEQPRATKAPAKQEYHAKPIEDSVSPEDRALLSQFGHIEDVLKPNVKPKHDVYRVYVVGESSGETVGPAPSEEMGLAA